MSLKSQSAMEFVGLASFMLLIMLGLFAVVSSNLIDAKEEGNKKIAKDIADYTYKEFELAKSLSDGYTRTFMMPQTFNGVNYNISLIDNRELIVEYLGNEYIKFLPSNISGNISKGNNRISKIKGVVYINSLAQSPECSDSIDNDHDGKIDDDDPGCEASLGTDETDCGDSVCEGGEACLFCSQDCGICDSSAKIIMRGDGINKMSFDGEGNAVLSGELTNNPNPAETSSDEFVVRDREGSAVAVINLDTGNMEIKGNVFENMPSLDPSLASNDFIVKNSAGGIIAYISESGDFFLKGILTENGNP